MTSRKEGIGHSIARRMQHKIEHEERPLSMDGLKALHGS